MNEYIKAMQDQIASLKSEVMFLIGAVKEKTIIIITIIIIIIIRRRRRRIMTILTKVVKYFLIIKLHLLKITMVML